MDNNRLNWFLDRVGLLIYSSITNMYVRVKDYKDAEWKLSNEELHGKKYFDTREEAEQLKNER